MTLGRAEQPVLLNLHWIYLAIALPSVIAFALVVPPFRVPDEQSHFIRAAHIAERGFVESSRNGLIGGYVDTGVVRFENVVFKNSPRPLTDLENRRIRTIKWKHASRWSEIGSSRYFPALYAPQALALLAGRALDMTLLTSFYLARITNAVVGVAITCLSIAVCRRGNLFLFSVALMPMALFMTGSVSQDAGIIALSLLCAAVITRGVEAKYLDFLVLTSIITLLALGRVALIALVILLWLPAWRKGKTITFTHQALATLFTIACVWGWLSLTHHLQGPIQGGPYADSASQTAFIRQHPYILVTAPCRTVTSDFASWCRMFVGQLGWLDVPLPMSVLVGGGVALLAAAAVTVSQGSPNYEKVDCALVAIACIAAPLLLMWALYVVWTPAGAEKVQGMQGRYLYSVVPLFAALLPRWTGGATASLPAIRLAGTAMCAALAVFLAGTSLHEVLVHYYS